MTITSKYNLNSSTRKNGLNLSRWIFKRIKRGIARVSGYKCRSCGKGFLYLDRIDVHDGTRVYKCDRCGEEFI